MRRPCFHFPPGASLLPFSPRVKSNTNEEEASPLGDTDTWMDGILLPTNGIDTGDSAVEPDSWARIKASFSQ